MHLDHDNEAKCLFIKTEKQQQMLGEAFLRAYMRCTNAALLCKMTPVNTPMVSAVAPSKGRRVATARRDRPFHAGGIVSHASEKNVSVPSAGSAHRYVSCSSSPPLGFTMAIE